MRQEGQHYLTYVEEIGLGSAYRGTLPTGVHMGMTEQELDAIGTRQVRRFFHFESPYWVLPSPREDVLFESHSADSDSDLLILKLKRESSYLLGYTGEALFVAWCALNDVLRTERYTPEVLASLRERRLTPLQFLQGPCQQRLWSGDVQPEFHDFLSKYYMGVTLTDDARWTWDVEAILGKAVAQDSWENYDRIAPQLALRLAQWRGR